MGFRNGFYGNGMMGGGWGALLVGLLWLVIIACIILLIVRLVRHGGHQHGPMMMGGMHPGDMGMTPPAPGHDEAVAIARRRFASGEITKEQFDEMMKTLG